MCFALSVCARYHPAVSYEPYWLGRDVGDGIGVIPSEEQLMFGGTAGEEISASLGGFNPPPWSLPSSSASNKFEVALSPSAGDKPTETPLASSGNEVNVGKPKTASISFETEP